MNITTIAFLLSTVSCFMNCVGYLFIKLSHLRSEKQNIHFLKTWQFNFGFFNYLAGYGLNMCTIQIQNIGCLANADMITLSSAAALAMIFNCILATTVLNELFTRYDLASIVLISCGAGLCVFMSSFTP